MNVITPVEARHPFLTGKPKRLFIDGRWVEAASSKTFETQNPSTGEVLATVAEGDREDIDRAVEAARRAFNGPWRKFKPFERQNLLLKLADLVDQNFEELALLDTLDMGAPISRTRASRLRAVGMLRYYAGQATSIQGETIEKLAAWRIRQLHAQGAGGRRRRHHPVEWAADRHDLEDRPGAGHWLHRGAQAGRGGAARLAALGRAVPGSRRAARRGQRGDRLRRDRRRGAGGAS